jgi:AcrR family transcriptional regulator
LTRFAPRREPQQARSRQRVRRILDATARLVAKGGVFAVNTNAIARLARLPVGTLYQFFPNREAVLEALMQSQLEAFDEALWPWLAPSQDEQPLGAYVDRIVEALAKAYLKVPGLAPLLKGLRYDKQFAKLSARNNARVAEALAELVKRRVPRTPRRRALAIGTAVVEASDAVLMAWLQTRDRALLAELKTMLRAYGAELLSAVEHE